MQTSDVLQADYAAILNVKEPLEQAATALGRGIPFTGAMTKLARGQQRKETSYGQRPTTPTSSSQPYAAEEASALVWNTL